MHVHVLVRLCVVFVLVRLWVLLIVGLLSYSFVGLMSVAMIIMVELLMATYCFVSFIAAGVTGVVQISFR